MAGQIITYAGAEFKCIDCVPEYAEYHTIFVAKEPHVDEEGRSYQVINTNWRDQKILHPVRAHSTESGYRRLNLPRLTNGTKRMAFLHRLVFLTWQDELPSNYRALEINHRDENKVNNHLSNLELISHQANLNYGTHNQRMANTLVKNGPSARMVAIRIRNRQEFHFSNSHECARQLRLNASHVCECLAKRRHQHCGFVFCWEGDNSEARIDKLVAHATRRKIKN